MKFLTKILTVAMVAALGISTSWADNTKKIQAVELAHTSYTEAKETLANAPKPTKKLQTFLDQAISDLNDACNKNCTRFSCDEELGQVCTSSCPYNAIKNCAKAYNSSLKNEASVTRFLSDEDIEVDDNGIPEASQTRMPRKQTPKKSLSQRASDTYSSAKNKFSSAFGSKKSTQVDGEDSEGNSCTCNLTGLTSSTGTTTTTPATRQPVQQTQQPMQQQQQQPAPQDSACTPLMMRNGDC